MDENPFRELNEVADQLANMTWWQFMNWCVVLFALAALEYWLGA